MSDIFNPADALGLGDSPDDVAKQLYGYMASYLDDPEVGPILRQAAAGGWSVDMLKGALSKTTWWKTTSDAARTWDETADNDPATAERQISDKASQIRDQLVQQGVNLDDNTIRGVAKDSLRGGWSDQQTKLALDAELQRSPSVLKSKIGVELKALTRQFATPMSDDAIQARAAHIISGNSSEEIFRQYLVDQAKARYKDPALAAYLDGGGTVDQYADPYKQMAAQTLGIDPNQVDFSDPKWAAAINVKDPKTGDVRSMDYDEWTTYLKQNDNYGWQDTADGRKQAQSFVNDLGVAFGKVAG